VIGERGGTPGGRHAQWYQARPGDCAAGGVERSLFPKRAPAPIEKYVLSSAAKLSTIAPRTT